MAIAEAAQTAELGSPASVGMKIAIARVRRGSPAGIPILGICSTFCATAVSVDILHVTPWAFPDSTLELSISTTSLPYGVTRVRYMIKIIWRISIRIPLALAFDRKTEVD